MRRPSSRLPSAARRRAARMQGFMLIEVLVSILIFTIGVLALVGLQASLTQAETEAKNRADASMLASELIGTMWADNPLTNLAAYKTDACGSHPNCKQWRDKVEKALPKGKTEVDIENNTEITITISWTPTDGGDAHQYVTKTGINMDQ